MTSGQILWAVVMSLLVLSQTILILVKMLRDKNGRKRTGAGSGYDTRIKKLEDEMHNPGYGERLGILESEMENLKENNAKDHNLIRKSIEGLFTLINEIRK